MNSGWLVRAEDLREYSAAVLQAVSVPQDDAEVICGALLDAELRGLDTHGAIRLPQYVTLIKQGTVDPRPEIKIVKESANHALVDNGYGLGFLGSVKAMNLCIAKAKRAGIAMAGVCNSSHFGAAGYYARMAAELMSSIREPYSSPEMPIRFWRAKKSSRSSYWFSSV